jgi:hypothetical protein
MVRNAAYYFRPGLSYGGLAGSLKARLVSAGAIFDQKNSMVFPVGRATLGQLLALMNSPAFETLGRLASAKGFGVGTLARLPIPPEALAAPRVGELAKRAVELTALLADRSETSRGFVGLRSILLGQEPQAELRLSVESARKAEADTIAELSALEHENAAFFAAALAGTTAADSGPGAAREARAQTPLSTVVKDIVSYAVGCMFGRYSVDLPGLILANQGDAIADYLAKVPAPAFLPVSDNVLPIMDGDWFAGDIVARFRQFLRTAFGEQYFAENLRFVTESLGVTELRDYFVKSFYKDHVQRYQKRPVYWLFSSPKGSFNALVAMHRYTPSTVSTVLHEYLRKYQATLESSRRQAVAKQEADRLR